MEWKPIETAPKDGTQILVALNECGDKKKPYVFEVVSYVNGEWCGDAYPVYPPTHWMPLPKGPNE